MLCLGAKFPKEVCAWKLLCVRVNAFACGWVMGDLSEIQMS